MRGHGSSVGPAGQGLGELAEKGHLRVGASCAPLKRRHSGARCLCGASEVRGQAGRSDIWRGRWQALQRRRLQTRTWSEVGTGKVRKAEQAFTGWAQCHKQHKREPRGKQCESGCWPVGPSQSLGLTEAPDLRGRGALEAHLAQTTENKHGCSPTVLPCERLGM